MRKIFLLTISLLLVVSTLFSGCNTTVTEFEQTERGVVVANNGLEYVAVASEITACVLGDFEFWAPVKGEGEFLQHLDCSTKTGMYRVGGQQDVLIRYTERNEFYNIYVKSGLLKTEVSLDNCIRMGYSRKSTYGFSTDPSHNSEVLGLLNSDKGITDCKEFIDEITSGQTAKEAGLYDLVTTPEGRFENCYGCGTVYGFLQEGLNLAIEMRVTSFDDRAYSIEINGTQYVLPQEWLEKLSN